MAEVKELAASLYVIENRFIQKRVKLKLPSHSKTIAELPRRYNSWVLKRYRYRYATFSVKTLGNQDVYWQVAGLSNVSLWNRARNTEEHLARPRVLFVVRWSARSEIVCRMVRGIKVKLNRS